MIQLALLGLAVLSALAGISTLVTGKISITKGTPVQGSAARGIGIGLLVLAAAMVFFAEIVLPRMK